MKKNNLLRVIAITCLAFFVLTWIIPTGNYEGANFTQSGLSALGIGDFFVYTFHSVFLSIAVISAVVILLIGGFYGVLNKSGIYQSFVDRVVKKFNGKEKLFLVISIVIFSLLTSLTSLIYPLFILVPFFMAVILLLGYDKMTAFLSTIGAILVGRIGTTYGYNLDGYNYSSNFFGLGINSNILFKFILLVLVTGVLIFFTLKTAKLNKKKKNEELNIPLYKKNTTNKSLVPFYVIFGIMIFVLFISMYNWEGAFGIKLFTDLYTKVTEFEIFGRTIFGDIIGAINPIGYWTNYELACMLIFNTVLIGLVYKLKFKDIFEGFIDGVKEFVGVALIGFLSTLIASIIFAQLYNLGTHTIFPTIANKVFSIAGENPGAISLGIVTSIATFFFYDLPYVFNALYSPVNALYKNIPDAVFVIQSVFGFISLILPTSIVLLMGLKMSDISFSEWFRKSWKLLLGLLVALIVSIALVILL